MTRCQIHQSIFSIFFCDVVYHHKNVFICAMNNYKIFQIGNTLRLSFQSESSVSGTELRLPSTCILPFIIRICQKRATIMCISNKNAYSWIHIIIENINYYTCCIILMNMHYNGFLRGPSRLTLITEVSHWELKLRSISPWTFFSLT